MVPTLALHRYLFHTDGGDTPHFTYDSSGPVRHHATQLYILAETILCSIGMEHEAARFSHTGRGPSQRFKYAGMG